MQPQTDEFPTSAIFFSLRAGAASDPADITVMGPDLGGGCFLLLDEVFFIDFCSVMIFKNVGYNPVLKRILIDKI